MKKMLLTLFGLFYFLQLFAQIQIDSSFSLSGSADMYFRYNINSTNDPDNGGTIAPGTSFANLPGFSLGMFNLIGAYENDKIGFTADLVFGPRGADAVFASLPGQNIINQLYGFWKVNDKVKLTLGNFNTFLGYEVISPVTNFNYSTSYLFSYGPFSHTGFKADFDLGKGFTAMAGVFNPTDFTDFNPFGEYVGGAQLGYENEQLGTWLNMILSDGFYQLDLTSGYQATEAFYVGVNTSLAKDAFAGAALYLQYALNSSVALGLRGEYFADNGIEVLGEDESVIDITLSANCKIGNLTIIPEFRVDTYSQQTVLTDATTGKMESSLASFVLAAVYGF